MKKRILLFVLTLALACSCILPAYAAERSGNGYHIRDVTFGLMEKSMSRRWPPRIKLNKEPPVR